MGNQELLESYITNAEAFAIAAHAIPSARLTHFPGEDEWTAAFVIHHMADSELQFGVRYANILAEDIPDIVPFDEEKFPKGLHYAKRSVTNSILAFEAANKLNCEILGYISPESWNRTSLHPVRGLMSLIDLVTLSGNHIGEHISQLRKA